MRAARRAARVMRAALDASKPYLPRWLVVVTVVTVISPIQGDEVLPLAVIAVYAMFRPALQYAVILAVREAWAEGKSDESS